MKLEQTLIETLQAIFQSESTIIDINQVQTQFDMNRRGELFVKAWISNPGLDSKIEIKLQSKALWEIVCLQNGVDKNLFNGVQ